MIESFLNTIFLYPIQLLIELIYVIFNRLFGSVVCSLIFSSLLFSFVSVFFQKEIFNIIKKERKINPVCGWFPFVAQILLFFAVNKFFSGLYDLTETGFLFLERLSDSDALLKFGDFSLNLIPVLSFLILFAVGFLLNDKKSFLFKISFILELSISYALLYNKSSGINIFWLIFFVGVFVLERILFYKKKETNIESDKNSSNYKFLYFISIGLLSVLLGLLIPLSYIASSAAEFENTTGNTIAYLLHTFFVSIGFFVFWCTVFFYSLKEKGRKIFAIILWCSFALFFVNYLFFGYDLGTISTDFAYDSDPLFSGVSIFANLFISTFIVVLFIFLSLKQRDLCNAMSVVFLAGMILISGYYYFTVKNTVDEVADMASERGTAEEPVIPLSTNGKNVFVIILDRAFSPYVPFVFEEEPDLLNQFDGFVYYPNTLSFGAYTNYAIPALLGGYEYRPSEINERDDVSLKEKHNEALLVMPLVFSEEGFKVGVSDPPYVNYRNSGDLSIFKRYKDIDSYIIFKHYNSDIQVEIDEKHDELRERNFLLYSVFRTVPTVLKNIIYDDANYLSSSQAISEGSTFMPYYTMLENLDTMTNVMQDDTNTFFLMYNCICHEPTYLSVPDYKPTVYKVDTDPYDGLNIRTVNGITMQWYDDYQMQHYQVHVSAFKLLGEWFDYLREVGVYDNTRIIICSDHGINTATGQFSSMVFSDELDIEEFNPLLMVKDFNATGFVTSDEFMTNADVPTLAFDNIIEDPINPFSGKIITNDAKYSEQLLVTQGDVCNTDINNGNVFDNGGQPWYIVTPGSIFEEKNWAKYSD